MEATKKLSVIDGENKKLVYLLICTLFLFLCLISSTLFMDSPTPQNIGGKTSSDLMYKAHIILLLKLRLSSSLSWK